MIIYYMISTIIVKTSEDMEKAKHIRSEVFIKEQNCPPEEEYDVYDETATHFITFYNGDLAACSRLIYSGDGLYKIGRIAVLKEYRKKGIGKEMCMFVIKIIEDLGGKIVKLDAQIQAKGFYESMGFIAQGDMFMEVGIPHITMMKTL